MTSSLLSSRHMFTTRLGGVSEGVYESWNLGENRGDDLACVRENFRRAGALMGTDADGFVITKQVHGTEVRIASDADRHTVGEAVPYAADGLVTARSGLALMIFIADCVPVLLEDAQPPCIAAGAAPWAIFWALRSERCALWAPSLHAYVRRSARASEPAASRRTPTCRRRSKTTSPATRRGLSSLSPTESSRSIFGEPTAAGSCRWGYAPKTSTCPTNARCAVGKNTGRTARRTAFVGRRLRR